MKTKIFTFAVCCMLFMSVAWAQKSVPIRVNDEDYVKIIGKRYEVVSSDIYLQAPEHLYPYLTLVYYNPQFPLPKEYIHILRGAILKILYVTRTEYFPPGNFHTHYVAKFETSGIYDKEFKIDPINLMEFNNKIPGGFDAGRDTRFNERFIRMNPTFLKEIE